MSESLIPDLDDTVCAVSDCLEVADSIARAGITLPALVGVPRGEERLVLDIPLCGAHQHLLRMGVAGFDLMT